MHHLLGFGHNPFGAVVVLVLIIVVISSLSRGSKL